MDYMRVRPISKADFDGVIRQAGGIRIAAEGSADYKLNEAIIELKLIQEEGFEKVSRQAKLAKLFRAYQPNAPVVVISPDRLSHVDSREYYNIVGGPIKNHVWRAFAVRS